MPASGELPRAARRPRPAARDRRCATTGWDGDVERLVRRLEEVVDTIPPCPYPGMVPFGRNDAARFFGRRAGGRRDQGPAGVAAAAVPRRTRRGAASRRCSRRACSPTSRARSPCTGPSARCGPEARRCARSARRSRPSSTARARRGGARAADRRSRRRGGPAAARRRPARGAVRAGERGRAGAVRRRARGDPRARRRLDRARDPRRLLRRADGERAVAARRRRQGRRAAARRRRSRRGDRGAGDVVPRRCSSRTCSSGSSPTPAASRVRCRSSRRRSSACGGRCACTGSRSQPTRASGATAEAACLPPSPTRQTRRSRRSRPTRCRSPSACCSGWSSSGRAGPIRAASSGSRTSAARATTTAPLERVLDVLAGSRLVTLERLGTPGATAAPRRGPRRPRARGADRRLADDARRGWPSAATPSRRAGGSRVTSRPGRSTTAPRHSSTTSSCARRERWLASPDARELGIPRGLPELVAVSAAELRRRRRLRRGAIAGLVGLLLAAIVLAGVFLRARNDADPPGQRRALA